MKYTIALSVLLSFICWFSQALAQTNVPAVPIDSAQVVDSTAIRDSLAQVALFNSLDSDLKYSEIILSPNKNTNPAKGIIDKVWKAGKHNLLFGLEQNLDLNKEITVYQGGIKHHRPIWVVFVVAFLFLVLGILRIIFPVELKIIVDAYYKERLLQQVSKEDNLATSWPYIFLYIVFSFSLGLFVCVLVSSFTDRNYLTFENFLKNSGFVALLFIAKILLIRFVSFIFLLEKIVREYIAVLYLVYFNSMFFLMPFLLAVIFVPVAYFPAIAVTYMVLVFLLFGYRFIRTAFHLFGNFQFSIFYLILYLCSLELAPILILVRALSN
ncbi:hypothetical protein GCM10022216_29790 [Sphingobacterium kyonggiense]|uniref:DUF4271 domain-containing protein n=1 Tax=Sphingobacterium kyonggiense TaxID=714075 RepID=A0ABP7Z2W8_9SPHI